MYFGPSFCIRLLYTLKRDQFLSSNNTVFLLHTLSLDKKKRNLMYYLFSLGVIIANAIPKK